MYFAFFLSLLYNIKVALEYVKLIFTYCIYIVNLVLQYKINLCADHNTIVLNTWLNSHTIYMHV